MKQSTFPEDDERLPDKNFHGTQRIITVPTKALHRFISRADLIQPTSSHPTSLSFLFGFAVYSSHCNPALTASTFQTSTFHNEFIYISHLNQVSLSSSSSFSF
jgi:hypothetical protein